MVKKSLNYFLVVAITLFALVSCATHSIKETRDLQIAKVDLTTARDGSYRGDYSYGGYTYEIEVEIKNQGISNIYIIKNRISKQAQMAEDVIPVILSTQRNDVDAISGATTTSKALLKTIEAALLKSLE